MGNFIRPFYLLSFILFLFLLNTFYKDIFRMDQSPKIRFLSVRKVGETKNISMEQFQENLRKSKAAKFKLEGQIQRRNNYQTHIGQSRISRGANDKQQKNKLKASQTNNQYDVMGSIKTKKNQQSQTRENNLMKSRKQPPSTKQQYFQSQQPAKTQIKATDMKSIEIQMRDLQDCLDLFQKGLFQRFLDKLNQICQRSPINLNLMRRTIDKVQKERQFYQQIKIQLADLDDSSALYSEPFEYNFFQSIPELLNKTNTKFMKSLQIQEMKSTKSKSTLISRIKYIFNQIQNKQKKHQAHLSRLYQVAEKQQRQQKQLKMNKQQIIILTKQLGVKQIQLERKQVVRNEQLKQMKQVTQDNHILKQKNLSLDNQLKQHQSNKDSLSNQLRHHQQNKTNYEQHIDQLRQKNNILASEISLLKIENKRLSNQFPQDKKEEEFKQIQKQQQMNQGESSQQQSLNQSILAVQKTQTSRVKEGKRSGENNKKKKKQGVKDNISKKQNPKGCIQTKKLQKNTKSDLKKVTQGTMKSKQTAIDSKELSLMTQKINGIKQQMEKYKKQTNMAIQRGFFQSSSLIKYEDIETKRSIQGMIYQSVSRRAAQFKLIYKYDQNIKNNFHHYIDNKPNLLVIVRLPKNVIVGGFCPDGLKQGYKSKEGFIFTINKERSSSYKLKNKPDAFAMTYDQYYIIFGNSQISIKMGVNTLSSNFGITNSCFDSKKDNFSQFLYGSQNKDQSTNQRTVVMKGYECYEVAFG